jgi:hypothetical protein
MKKQNRLETNNPELLIEDLIVNEDQAADVKGGPIEIRELTYRAVINEQQQ